MKVRKAQPKTLNQAYLILTANKVEFDDRIALIDLFFPETQMHMPEDKGEMTKEDYKARLANILWTTLMERGFRMNHTLERQYAKQQCCIWCGGAVITYGGSTSDDASWETRCGECGYLYDED